ncbi:TRAP transporter small permease [Chromohalobacter sp. HP20-39]|uniref:TRAP transporter small permease n=1 Tax=Chromohalobacter sp. HP20-39 TaxID=3079306 RepID=UPI00294B4E24|nr:TRAP transporter small permease [Chromohalobacter sp. HP20-39]MDV6318150.1 TRAP transporter small permease [Chromohalobacter sp. HP20-39]
MRAYLLLANRVIDQFNRLIGWGLVILLLVMTVLICWQVFARFVIGDPLYFSEEIARFSMLWLTFLGAGYAFRKSRLISVDIVLEYAGPWLSRFMRVLVVLVSLVFAFILIKYGLDIVDRVSFQTAPSTRVSMMWPYLSVPVGGIVIMINAVGLLIDECIGAEE